MGDADGAGPNAPVAAVNVLIAQAILVLRRVVRIQLHVFVRRPPVAFQCQHVVPARRSDRPRCPSLRVLGANIPNSVGTAAIPFDLSSTRTYPNTERAPPANARTGCGGDRDAAAANDRRNALPSMATTPPPNPAAQPRQATASPAADPRGPAR